MYERLEDLEDPTYLINQVYYTDSEAVLADYHSEVTRGRQNWLQDAYRDFLPQQGSARAYRATPLINNLFADENVQNAQSQSKPGLDEQAVLSGPKLYLLKLVEYNKIALLEKHGFAAPGPVLADLGEEDAQLAELQTCMTRLLRQTLL